MRNVRNECLLYPNSKCEIFTSYQALIKEKMSFVIYAKFKAMHVA